ncbi:hypothetical protein CDV31_015620 [Fusarium ambrosium]|uniref:Uncharacterized protein n=1 Tax=Fusarium ambrosium TaxID=131363 RepID=A0A428SLS5_9HYPO|nr:hypothetical protein CDV31_015620 [Fusarium ambrosium]
MHFRLSSRLAKSVKAKCRTISRQYTDYRRNRKIAKSIKYEVAQYPPTQPGAVNPWQGEPYQFAGEPDDWDQHLESGSELEYDPEEHIDEEQYLRYGFDVDDFMKWWRTFESALSDSGFLAHDGILAPEFFAEDLNVLWFLFGEESRNMQALPPLSRQDKVVSFCETNVRVSGVGTLLETCDPLRGMAKVFDQLNRDELVAYIWPSDIREHVEHVNAYIDEKPLNSTLSS